MCFSFGGQNVLSVAFTMRADTDESVNAIHFSLKGRFAIFKIM